MLPSRSLTRAILNKKRPAYIKSLLNNDYNHIYEKRLVKSFEESTDFETCLKSVSDRFQKAHDQYKLIQSTGQLAAQEASNKSFMKTVSKAKARLLANEAAMYVAEKQSRKVWRSIRMKKELETYMVAKEHEKILFRTLTALTKSIEDGNGMCSLKRRVYTKVIDMLCEIGKEQDPRVSYAIDLSV